ACRLGEFLAANCFAKRMECVELAPALEPSTAIRQRQPVLRSSTAEGGQAGRTPYASRGSVAALPHWVLRVSAVKIPASPSKPQRRDDHSAAKPQPNVARPRESVSG